MLLINKVLKLNFYFQELGFKTNYEQDPAFAHDVNKISALAFLKPNDVSQGFDDLYNSLPQILQPLLNRLGTMGSTSGPHYILTRKFIEKRFLIRFS